MAFLLISVSMENFQSSIMYFVKQTKWTKLSSNQVEHLLITSAPLDLKGVWFTGIYCMAASSVYLVNQLLQNEVSCVFWQRFWCCSWFRLSPWSVQQCCDQCHWFSTGPLCSEDQMWSKPNWPFLFSLCYHCSPASLNAWPISCCF